MGTKYFSIWAIALAGTALFGAQAQARTIVACGEERNLGPKHADVAVVESDETLAIEYYVDGKLLPENRATMSDGEHGELVVLINLNEENDNQKFVFNSKKGTAQEYLIKNDKEKKVGAPIKCTFGDS